MSQSVFCCSCGAWIIVGSNTCLTYEDTQDMARLHGWEIDDMSRPRGHPRGVRCPNCRPDITRFGVPRPDKDSGGVK